MNSKAVFQCSACKNVFHQNGLHLSVHGKAVVHICPACLEGSKEIQLTVPHSVDNCLLRGLQPAP